MSLRSEAAQHFSRLESMQDGGVTTPTSNRPSSTPTPTPTPSTQGPTPDDLIKFIRRASSSQLAALVTQIRALKAGQNVLSISAGGPFPSTFAFNPKRWVDYGHEIESRNNALAAQAKATGGGTPAASGTSFWDRLLNAGKIAKEAGTVAPVDTTLNAGDTYHSPEWRPGELELMQRQQAEQEASDRATLAQNMGQLEQAEQSSRRDALLTAAQALFAAASTAAPPGMTTYPGYEPGGIAEVAAKVSGNAVPASLQAPITRKPVSFDVLNAFDLGPLKEQIAAIMGMSGAKKGLVSMADGGTAYMDDITRYKAGIAGKTPDEIAMINRYLAGLGGGTSTSATSLDAILGQAIYESWLQNQLQQEELTGATIPNVRNTIAQTMGYNDTGQPTMDMRSLLASTKANPRNIIEGLFLGRGMGVPADLSNVEAVEGGWNVSGGGGATGGGGDSSGGGGGGTAASTSINQATAAGQGVPGKDISLGTPLSNIYDLIRANLSGQIGLNPSGDQVITGTPNFTPQQQALIGGANYTYDYTPEGYVPRPMTAAETAAVQAKQAAALNDPFAKFGSGVGGSLGGGGNLSKALGSYPTGVNEGAMATWWASPAGLAYKAKTGIAAEGKVVSGPAISTVGERGGDAGTEYAYLPPGAVVAPKPAGERPSMDGAIRAIAAQLFKSGLGGPAPARMATGGSVFSPTVTGTLPRSLLDAPALQAFMNPTNAGLPSIHKMPALFQPFGEGGPEAPNWLDPRAILAYAHGDPTEQATMESVTSAYGWDPATALEMGRRAMAGFGKPVTGTASYRPYWQW